MDYIIRDEDGERSWMRQPLWSEFGKKLAYEVVSNSEVLFAGDDDYLFLVLASGDEIVAKSKTAHGRRERASCVPVIIGNAEIE